MSDVNPYAAPPEWDSSDPDAVAMAELVDEYGQTIGVWRSGRILVMHKQARLPDRCVKTNQPTGPDERWRHTFIWCHWAVILGLLVNLILVLILYLIFRKKATVEMGLIRSRLSRRRRALLGGWMLILAGFVGFFLFLIPMFDSRSEPNPIYLFLLGASVITGIVGLVWASIGSSIVAPKHIDKHYIRLKGVHPDYLAMLPEWPGL